MKYFKFPIIKKEFELDKKHTVIDKILTFIFSFIPKSNPEFDSLIHLVNVWYIEYDDLNNYVEREIGLNLNNKVIVKMPFKKEYGYWIDVDMKFKDFQNRFNIEIIKSSEFEEKWNELQ